MKAYELINNPSKWGQGADVLLGSRRLCAFTAIQVAHKHDWFECDLRLRDHIGGDRSIVKWNDASTWEIVYNTLRELDI